MKKIAIVIMLVLLFACNKKLDLKPISTLVVPTTARELEHLLDNTAVMINTPGLAHLSADEYEIPTLANFQALATATTRSAYTWNADVFEGQGQVPDWTVPYAQIFYCNNVLEVVDQRNLDGELAGRQVKGWALFARAYAFYNLVGLFAKAYDANTAQTDLGIPLKLRAGITELVPRNTVEETYQQIIKDLFQAKDLLPRNITADKRNRPSQVAVFALLARVYLSMRNYEMAELNADQAMAIYAKLTNYKTLTVSNTSSFSNYNSEETIYFSHNANVPYSQTTYSSGGLYRVSPALINSYAVTDLRKQIYFRQGSTPGNYIWKALNSPNAYPFTGLATDELYLVKAECLARRNAVPAAMDKLNELLVNRHHPEATNPSGTYQPLSASNANEALDMVLLERQKELIWRGLRWSDLKRLNLEGRNITLSRTVGSQVYTLAPNSARYVLPIPDDEVILSGIVQNVR